MKIMEQISYLKGLAEGLDIAGEKSKEARLLTAMLDLLEELCDKVSTLEEEVEVMNDTVDALADEMMDFEEDYYGGDDGTWPYDGEEDDDDEDEDDEDFEEEDDEEIMYAVNCPECDNEMLLDEDTLLQGNIRCEGCGHVLSIEIVDEDNEEEDEEE